MSYMALGYADQVLTGNVEVEEAELLSQSMGGRAVSRPLEGALAGPFDDQSIEIIREKAMPLALTAAATVAAAMMAPSAGTRRLALLAGVAAAVFITRKKRSTSGPETGGGFAPPSIEVRGTAMPDPYAPVVMHPDAIPTSIDDLIGALSQDSRMTPALSAANFAGSPQVISMQDIPLRLSQLRIVKYMLQQNGLALDTAGTFDTQGNGRITLVRDNYGYRILAD